MKFKVATNIEKHRSIIFIHSYIFILHKENQTQ